MEFKCCKFTEVAKTLICDALLQCLALETLRWTEYSEYGNSPPSLILPLGQILQWTTLTEFQFDNYDSESLMTLIQALEKNDTLLKLTVN